MTWTTNPPQHMGLPGGSTSLWPVLSSLFPRVSCHYSCVLWTGDRPNLDSVPPSPPLPFTSTVCRPYPSRSPRPSLLPQSWSLSGFGCSPAVPVSQSQSIFESCRLHIPRSLVVPSLQPPVCCPQCVKVQTLSRQIRAKDTRLSRIISPRVKHSPARPPLQVSLFPGSVDQLALVFLQSCRLLLCG